MVGQNILSVRSCLDVGILNINSNNSLSLMFLCQKDSWDVQNISYRNLAAWGQEGYLASLQLV